MIREHERRATVLSGGDGGVGRVLQRRDGRGGCMTRETVWRNVPQRR